MDANQVIQELNDVTDPERAKHSPRFFKAGPGEYGEGDKFLGITVPNQRKIAKKYLPLDKQEIEKMLQNEYHEVRLTALMIMVYRVEKGNSEELEGMADLYLNNLQAVNNWDLVDSSAHQILGRYLKDRSRNLLYEFAQSDDLWKKRIAMISCHRYIRTDDFDDALKIAEILLQDEHDLIHKAVGWMLREIGNRDLATEEAFLKHHYEKMPRTMLRYAIEKFEDPLRLQYLHGNI